MSLGLSKIDGKFSSVAEMQLEKIPNERLVCVTDSSSDPATVDFYVTSETQNAGGLLLPSGNYANPTPQGGGGGGDMFKAVYDPNNVNSNAFDRGNHTGTQPISSVTNLQTEINAKEDGLGNPSTDNYVLASTAAGVRTWVPNLAVATNLGYTQSTTDGTITSSTGDDAKIPAGSNTSASLMLPGDKTKLDSVGDNAQLISVQAGTNVTVDNTDPQNPIINASGGGGGGGKSLPYTLSGTGSEVIGVGGRRGTLIQIQVPVSLDAVPSSVTASGTLRGSFYRNDTNNIGNQTFDAATDLTYQAANSTKDMLSFNATVIDVGWSAWGRISGNGSAWSITLNA